MPFVYGFLRKARRHGWRPGRPDIGLPDGEDGEDGGGDGEDGELPEVLPPERPSIPKPPSGIWPPMRPEDPWRPVPPEGWEKPSFPERPGQGLPPQLPGAPPGGLPQPPAGGIGGRPPERPGGGGGGGEGGGDEEAGQLPVFPPGAIFPPLPPGVHGKYLALVLVGGMPGVRYRYVVIDADARFPEGLPEPPAGGIGRPPQRPGPAR